METHGKQTNNNNNLIAVHSERNSNKQKQTPTTKTAEAMNNSQKTDTDALYTTKQLAPQFTSIRATSAHSTTKQPINNAETKNMELGSKCQAK